MLILSKLENFLFDAKTWKIVLLIAALSLFKTGLWSFPALHGSRAIAMAPFVNPFVDVDAQYLFWSWFSPYLASLAGIIRPTSFMLFHLAFSVAFTLLFVRIALLFLPAGAARASILLFSVLPASTTAYFWVGPDSATLFLLMLALAFPAARLLVFLIGILLGMQHFEHAFFAAGALLGAAFLSERQGYAIKYPARFGAFLLGGAVLGKLALVAIFRANGIDVASGRMHYLEVHAGDLLQQFFFHFHYIVWSALGLGWLIALRFADWGRRSLPFFLALGGLCLLLLVSADQTRVLAIVSFPLLAAYWLLNPDFLVRLSRREVALLFGLWALLPLGWVWEGLPKWSVFPYDVAYLLHQWFGWFDIPQPMLWPFGQPGQ